jgi:hypothetical protein
MAAREPLATGDDSLDRLLSTARWPEPEPERLSRLRQRWFDLRRLRPPGSLLSAAVAASLVLASGTACWRWVARPAMISISGLPSAMEVARTDRSADKRMPDQPFASREPTLYEQVLAISLQSEATRVPVRHDRALKPADVTALESILRDLVDCPGADATALVACLPGDRGAYEQALWNILAGARQDYWEPAVRLLAEVGTWRSLPVLAAWSAHPETHGAATRGLARLADAGTLTRLAIREPDQGLRRQLLAGLLSRGTPDAVRMYLNFVSKPATTADALAAARCVDRPPVEQLFAILTGPAVSARLAAAQVLGRLDHPEIAQRLAHMAASNVSRQEALVGLLSSQRADASLLVEQARQDLNLMAAVRAAEWQFRQLGNGGKAS